MITIMFMIFLPGRLGTESTYAIGIVSTSAQTTPPTRILKLFMNAIRKLRDHGVAFNILTVLTAQLAKHPQKLYVGPVVYPVRRQAVSRPVPWKIHDIILDGIYDLTISVYLGDGVLIEPAVPVYSRSAYYRLQITPSLVIIPVTSSGGIISKRG